MTNKSIARVLNETASLIEITGGNPFRGRAFQRAARTIERMEEPAEDLLAAGTLTDIRGIGAGLAAQIQDLIDHGTFALRDELLSALPPGLLDVLAVKGLGAKKARRLWKELDITSLDDLEAAGVAGRLAELDGFGAKSQTNILDNIALLRTYQQRRRYAEVMRLVTPLLGRLREHPAIERAEVSGELRRCMETVESADLLIAATDPSVVCEALADLLDEDSPEPGSDMFMYTGVLANGLPLHLSIVPASRFGSAWWRRTGSVEHCNAFEQIYGAPDDHGVEATVYESAGLPVIPPELREHDGELEAAASGTLPKLITEADLRGSLHNHSTYSDGAHTLEQMAEAARAMGLSYFGICDHSQSLQIANGMSTERVYEQQEEIRRLNARYEQEGSAPFRIFSGIESDILADGALDYSDDVLASFDFIVASVHTRFNMTEQEATARIVTAIKNPYTTILGHPTGRLLLAREGYPLDHERVIAACARHGVAIELNANPYRLDLDWRWIRKATEQGVLISINPDAHAIDQLPYVRWGVAVARKGWLTADQCLNAMPLNVFSDWLDKRRSKAMVNSE